MDKIKIAHINNTHGLKGECKLTVFSDEPDDIVNFKFLYDQNNQKFEIDSLKYFKDTAICKFKHIHSIDDALKVKGIDLFVTRDMFKQLEKGTYYIVDLIGINVYEDDTVLGEVIDVITTGGNDLFCIKGRNQKEFYIPNVKEFVKNVDIENKRIDIKTIEGLIE